MDRMIYVDADPLASRHLTGIGRYTARLAMALRALGPVRFFSQGQEVVVPSRLSWHPDQDLASWAKRVWRGRRVALAAVPETSLGVYGGLRSPRRQFAFEVSILYDFTPLILPGTHSARNRRAFQDFFARGLPASDLALAISEATRADARWLCDLPAVRIVVAPPGPSLCVEGHLHAGPVAREPRVGLAVSTLEPRKNARFALDWFRDSEELPAEAELWWAGPVGWLTSRRSLRALGRASRRRVRFLGMVPDRELCRLYQTAGWSIYPSLYEGFSFPVLDALRHGAAVLASGNSSLVEFAGPGVAFFDPCDGATLDAAFRGLSTIKPPPPRDVLDGTYSWDRAAERVGRVLSGHPGVGPPAPVSPRGLSLGSGGCRRGGSSW